MQELFKAIFKGFKIGIFVGMLIGLNSIESLASPQAIDSSIIRLKSGVLLVQLQSKTGTTTAYYEKGYPALAEEIEKNQRAGNQRIMRAFEESFRFCEVLFFYSDHLSFLKAKQFDSLVMYDAKGSEVSSERLMLDYYIVATYVNPKKIKNKTSLYSQSRLYMVNDAFEEVSKDFPESIRWPTEIPKLIKVKKRVYQWNNSLQNYYYRQPAKLE
jgi:hypothetical protein